MECTLPDWSQPQGDFRWARAGKRACETPDGVNDYQKIVWYLDLPLTITEKAVTVTSILEKYYWYVETIFSDYNGFWGGAYKKMMQGFPPPNPL